MNNMNVGTGVALPRNETIEQPREGVVQLFSLEGKLDQLNKLILSVHERFEFVLAPVPPKDVPQETKMPSVSSFTQRLIACNVLLEKEIRLLQELLERSEV